MESESQNTHPMAELAGRGVDNYEIVRRITTVGRSKFAAVFEGFDLAHLRPCLIKAPNPMGRKRIKREIEVLHALRDGPNVLKLLDVVWDPHTESPSLVFEMFENMDYRSLYPRLDGDDVRCYMRQLLAALEFCHGLSIMHRDVRPDNVMMNHATREVKLFGWDYAVRHSPHRAYSTRIGHPFIKSPELLLDMEEHDCAVDMWNTGVILASLVFRRDPFFHGVTTTDVLQRITRTLGAEGLLNFLERYDIDSPDDLPAITAVERRPWAGFIAEDNRLADAAAVDLVDRILRWDPRERLTAGRALQHPFFTAQHTRPTRE